MTYPVALKNATVYRYILIKSLESGVGIPIKQEHWKRIWQLTEEAWEWLHTQIGNSDSSPEKPKLEITRIKSQRIAGFPWKGSVDGALSISMEARLFFDSGFLQMGIWYHGERSEKDFIKLQERLQDIMFQTDDFSDVRDSLQIDEIFCWYAEVDEGESLTQLTPYFLELYKEFDDRIDVCNYSWGCVGIPRDQKTPMFVLSHENAPGVEDTSWFINVVVPRLALFSQKIASQYHEYEAKQSEVKKKAQKLEEALRGPEYGGDLHELEKRIQEISFQVDGLVEKLSWLKKQLIGMDDNLRQIKRALLDPVLFREITVLRQIFDESNALLTDHVRTDFEKFQAHNDEALLTLQTLQAFVSVERAKTDRKMILILGVVGLVLALVDGFADDLSTFAKVLIVLAGTMIGTVIWFWNSGKDKIKPETEKLLE